MWLHASDSAFGVEQEKQERRAEAERQEQLQQKGVPSEFPTLTIMCCVFNECMLTSF